MTFRELAQGCERQLRGWGYSDDTCTSYDRTWMQFLAFVKSGGGNDDIRSFNDRNTFAFSEWLAQKKIHPNTIIKMLSALRALARYGMMCHDDQDRRLMKDDPTRSFRWPQGQRHETKWAHPDELRALIDHPVATYKAIARDILIETGIRVGEASRLNVGHFRENGGRYFLAIQPKGRGRNKATRDVPLSKGLGDAIRNWLLLRSEPNELDSPLLVNSLGKRWNRKVLGNMIADLGAAAGITRMRVSPHKLRHSKNVRDRIAGIDAPTRARLNGHSSLRSQERYDHIFGHELHDAAENSLDQLQQWIGKPYRTDAETTAEERNEQPHNPNDYAEKDD